MVDIDVELIEGEPPKVLVDGLEVPVVYLQYRYVTESDRLSENMLQGTIILDDFREVNFYKDMKTGVVSQF